MAQNMENIDFRTFFTVTSQQWSLLKYYCDFWVPWNISDQIHRILCPKLLLLFFFFEKMHKIFKNKAQGCSTPLSWIHTQNESKRKRISTSLFQLNAMIGYFAQSMIGQYAAVGKRIAVAFRLWIHLYSNNGQRIRLVTRIQARIDIKQPKNISLLI